MRTNTLPEGIIWDDQQDQQAQPLPHDVAWDGNPQEGQPRGEKQADNVPEWGQENPNLYGAYGAVKETAGALTKAAMNLPQSTVKVAGDIYQAVRHPLDTAEAIGKTALGAAELAVPGEQGHEDMARTLGQFFADRYGSLEALRDTLENDPAGLALDVSSFFAAGGAGLRGAGVVSKTSGAAALKGAGMVSKTAGVAARTGAELVSKTAGVAARTGEGLIRAGEVATKAAAATDPINHAAKIGASTLRSAGKVGSEVLGATTGAGAEGIRQAARGEPAFKEALRGRVVPEDILGHAQDALSVIRDERNATYRQRLAELREVDKQIDIAPIRDRLGKLLDSYNIAQDAEGGLDFSRSRLTSAESADVQGVLNEIMQWGEREGDLTPAGLDILKSRLDNFYSDSSRVRGVVSILRNKVKKTIIDEVPEYQQMVGDYEQATKQISEMQRALSLNNRAMMDTAVKKLTSTMKENFGFRLDLLERLGQMAGTDIRPEVAGISMQQAIPKGLIGKGVFTSTAMGSWLTSNPMALGGLLLASPRVIGEFLHAAGVAKNGVNKLLYSRSFRDARKLMAETGSKTVIYQAGRTAEIVGKTAELEQEIIAPTQQLDPLIPGKSQSEVLEPVTESVVEPEKSILEKEDPEQSRIPFSVPTVEVPSGLEITTQIVGERSGLKATAKIDAKMAIESMTDLVEKLNKVSQKGLITGTLNSNINKHAIPAQTANQIKATWEDYKNEGYGAQEAAERAVKDVLAQAQEQLGDIINQVNAQVSEKALNLVPQVQETKPEHLDA